MLPPSLATLFRATDLSELYDRRNGFFAFESALHVFPIGSLCTGYSLEVWNASNTWRDGYDGMENILFFAEDIFGEQFGCTANRQIVRFNPETGQQEVFAMDLLNWAERILVSYEVELGYPVARDWQAANGPLPAKSRLLPKQFFMFGGPFTAANLYSLDAVQGMRLRADLYRQTRDLPDSARVRLRVASTPL
jgi:hypothetical protein